MSARYWVGELQELRRCRDSWMYHARRSTGDDRAFCEDCARVVAHEIAELKARHKEKTK